MRGVLLQSLEAYLHQPKLSLDHPERMLDFGADTGLAVFLLLHFGLGSAFRHPGNVGGSGGDVPLQVVAVDSPRRTPVA